jgi:hypothetical protein
MSFLTVAKYRKGPAWCVCVVSGCTINPEGLQRKQRFEDKCSMEVLTNYKRSGRELPKPAMVRAFCSAQFAASESGITFEQEKETP